MSAPAEQLNESALRAEIEVLMKQKETIKNAIRDDVGKKEKLKEQYTQVTAQLTDLSRRLINMKKDTAMSTKLGGKPVAPSEPATPKNVAAPSEPATPKNAVLAPSEPVTPRNAASPRNAPSTPRNESGAPIDRPPTLEHMKSLPLGPPEDEPPPLPEDQDPPPPPPEDDSAPPAAGPSIDSDEDLPEPPDLEEEPEWLKGVDLSKPISPEMTKQIFETFDADKNGYLDKQEAALFLTEWCSQQGVKDVEKVKTEFWKRFDADGDGKITKDELLTAFQPVKRPQNAAEREVAFKSRLAHASREWVTLQGETSATGVTGCLMEGHLQKKGAQNKNFKRRYCVLTREQMLYYENLETNQLNGSLAISFESTAGPLEGTSFWVCPVPGGRQYEFIADSIEDQSKWLASIASLQTQPQGIFGSTHEGWLMKKGQKRNVWNRRYFALCKDKLVYYESLESKKLAGEMDLSASSVVLKEEAKTFLTICPGGDRILQLEAPDANARNAWVAVMEKYIYSKILQQSVDPKRKEGQLRGTLLVKVFKVHSLAVPKGFLAAAGSARLGKISALAVSLRAGSLVQRTRAFDGWFKAVYNQTFIFPKSQWAQGTDLVCELMEGTGKSKTLGTVKFAWPEEKKAFTKGEFSFVDKAGGAQGQLEIAIVDSDIIGDSLQLQVILNPEPLTGIDQYILGKQLGKGGCGTVYLAKHKLTHNTVAIKVVAKEKEFEVRTEMDVMQMLKHPNCVKLEEMIEMKTNIYMVMELMDDNLQTRIYEKYNGKVPEDICRMWMKQMATALTYCHDMGVVHRDIKPENLMFSSGSSDIKLTDFGLATYKQAVMKESCGTPPFMAPELVTQKPYGKEVDLWALGVALFQTLTGGMPFDQPTQELTFIAIKRASYIIRPEWNFSPELIHLFKSIFEVDPKLRLTAAQMLEHPWVLGVPLGDYVVPNRKEVYEALKDAQKPKPSSSPATQSMVRRRLKDEGD